MEFVYWQDRPRSGPKAEPPNLNSLWPPMSFLSEPPDRFRLEPSWQEVLGDEFNQEYMRELRAFLRAEKAAQTAIYPPEGEIFAAFAVTPFSKTKVVILGQDPYHGARQAHGLAFSVRPGNKIPPSLANIFKELHADLGIPPSPHGFLQGWAEQGVLLLNNVLTVAAGKAGSHHGQGWERFTSQAIARLNAGRQRLVFLLWGREAQAKGELIDPTRHLLLKSAHPSPFSAYRGFFANHHFSKTNQYLQQHNREPINWQLPPPPC